MPISFPSTPSVNQTHTHSGITWTFDGTVWRRAAAGGGSATITVANAAPNSPTEGNQWFDSENAELNVYYGNSWVIVNSDGAVGYTGSEGSAGVNGYTGSAGGAGSNGFTGSSGTTGFTGSAGTNAAIYSVATVDTGYFAIPTGNTAQRPGTVGNGAVRVNSTTNYLEIFYNSNWYNLNYIGAIAASGGTVVTNGNYKIHTFTVSDTLTITEAPPTAEIQYLIVAGGGGGAGTGSGGGAGGVLTGTISISAQSYSITVGAGGNGGTAAPTAGSKGGNSVAFGLTAQGGGAGVSHGNLMTADQNGGSGAGAPQRTGGSAEAGGLGVVGPPRQGYNGGAGVVEGSWVATSAGGGGAGGVGANAGNSAGNGNGGIGIINPIENSTIGQNVSGVYWIAGGGGGGEVNGSVVGSAGQGGGGTGNFNGPGSSGTTNTGGGGGGGSYDGSYKAGGNGGSGVVIIRYRYQ